MQRALKRGPLHLMVIAHKEKGEFKCLNISANVSY